MINTAIDLELSYINTNHPDFIGLTILLSKTNMVTNNDDEEPTYEEYTSTSDGSTLTGFDDKQKQGYQGVVHQITATEQKQIGVLKQLLDSYFGIVKKKHPRSRNKNYYAKHG